MLLTELFHRPLLLEDGPPLTKGAKNILADKGLIAKIADQLKDDFTVPSADRKVFRKQSDEQIAEWFVRKLDAMERRGVGGVIYGRDGQFHLWAAINYGNGTDSWEDVEGIMPGSLRDFVILKNRNLLDARHSDIQKFKGVGVLSRYIMHHYNDELKDIRKDAELAYLMKGARSVKLADNEDYRLYLLQNRGAACAFGKGATWCTANSHTDYNWKRYSGQNPDTKGAAVIGLVVKPEKRAAHPDVKIEEKYQFDAGEWGSFKDPGNRDVSPRLINEVFPYLLSDLIKGLQNNQMAIENPRGPNDPDNLELVPYDVAEEIEKLKTKLSHYWTDQVRPVKKEKPEETDDADDADKEPANDAAQSADDQTPNDVDAPPRNPPAV